MNDNQCTDAPLKREKPATVEIAHTRAMNNHKRIILLFLHPPAFIPVVPAIASGRLEIKTATNIARLTLPPSNIPNPITIDSGIPSRIIPNNIGTTRLELCDASISIWLMAPIFSISLSLKKNTRAPLNNPNAGNPVPFASFTASKINSYDTAEINVPAPNAMMMPSVLLLRVILEAMNPPRINEEVASKPHKNAFNIRKDFRSITDKK
jgi:hypothetical protein